MSDLVERLYEEAADDVESWQWKAADEIERFTARAERAEAENERLTARAERAEAENERLREELLNAATDLGAEGNTVAEDRYRQEALREEG